MTVRCAAQKIKRQGLESEFAGVMARNRDHNFKNCAAIGEPIPNRPFPFIPLPLAVA